MNLCPPPKSSIQTTKKIHLIEFDYIRVIAMLFVIAVHTLAVIDFKDPVSFFYFQLMQIIFFTCNGMFFLMSGKFALIERQSLYLYYLKKMVYLGIPILIFFYIRSLYEGSNYFLNLLGELADTEYWFLYVLIGNIVLAPLLAKAFVNFNLTECWLFLGFGLFAHAMMMICSICHVNYCWSFIFSGYSLYFYLGTCVEKIIYTKRVKEILFTLAFVGVGISLILKYKGVTNYIHDLSPIFTIITLGTYFGILSLAKRLKDKLSNLSPVIMFIAKHSFVVYLVHMMVFEITIKYYPMQWTGSLSILLHLIMTVIVFIFSLIVAVVVDNFFLNPLCSKIMQLATSKKKCKDNR
ncbi:acyltransferase [Parasutterella secunda]|uniref:Acyltransferase n=1 Tax=Parasutterella secunda TaxID=626947 RepID=A0ABS2GUU6_9BURK|nr:acyltransferase [Parasutterella secunda]MBM6928981.1 acyltransferase [Parasutterella secunda]